MACELCPDGVQTAPRYGGHHVYVGLNDLYIHPEQDTDEELNRSLPKAATEWSRIVNLYTMCDLTKASDKKFVGLPGTAADFNGTRLSPDYDSLCRVAEEST